MEWKNEYALGVELIDKQHQELFRAANRVLRIVDTGEDDRSRRACEEAVKYLKNYTIQHFQDEEMYQLSTAYEGYIRHKALHDEFRKTVLIQEQRMVAEDFSRDSVMGFMKILSAWLVSHIMKEDQRISKREE